MADVSRSRPAREPAWRPGERREVHPARRWARRLAWTAAALGLVALFVWLLWSPPKTNPVAFAAIVVASDDAGQLATPAYAVGDLTKLADLSWDGQLKPDGAFQEIPGLKSLKGPVDALVCYVAAHVAVRPGENSDSAAQVALLSSDFRRARLPEFLSDAGDSSAIPLREVLSSISKLRAGVKIVLLDTPRTHAEPWLSILENDWTETLESDVKAVDDDKLWVVCAGSTQALSRVDHHHGRSLFAQQVAEVLQGRHDKNDNGQVDLEDLQERVKEVSGQTPFISSSSAIAHQDVVLPRQLKSRTPAPVEEAPDDAANKAADPAKANKKPKAPPPDPAWLAHDELQSLDAKLEVSPVDYAPGLWHKLQSQLIWNDWRRHTGAAQGDDLLWKELTDGKLSLALAPEARGGNLTHAAMAPFDEAIGNYQSTRQKAWQAAPEPYRSAVRRRNLLLARLPEYWRWKAACGQLNEESVKADLAALAAYCGQIATFERQDDRSLAETLAEPTGKESIDDLTKKVTTGIHDEVVRLCESHDSRDKAAALGAAEQQRIEQLLLTSLPSAEDRQRLWSVLKDTEIASGGIDATLQVVTGQARLEAALANFQADLRSSSGATVPDDPWSGTALELGKLTNDFASLDSRLQFAEHLIAFRVALLERIGKAPNSPADELFARAADAHTERDDRAGSIAALRNWKTKLNVVVGPRPDVDLGDISEQTFTVEIKGGAPNQVPYLRFSSIPDSLRLARDGKPVEPGDTVTGERLEFQLRHISGNAAGETVNLLATAVVSDASGATEFAPVEIPVQLPSLSAFELVPINASQLVRVEQSEHETTDGPSAEHVWLLAHPNRDSSYALGLNQTSGAHADVNIDLYALDSRWSAEQGWPTTIDELTSVAEPLDVHVTVAPGNGIRALTFQRPAPTPPPAAPGVAPPAAAPVAAEALPLPSLQLVAVISELKGDVVVRRHLKWLGIEPLHPNRFIAAGESRINSRDGESRVEFSLASHASSDAGLAMPSNGMSIALGMSDELREAVGAAEITQGAVRLMQNKSLTPTMVLPSSLDEVSDRRLFIDVDGYPRAFMWQLPPDLREIERFNNNRIYIRQPRALATDQPILTLKPNALIDVQLEVDAVNPNGTFEVGLRMIDEELDSSSARDRFEPQVLRGTRQYRPSLKTDPMTGALTIHCAVSDFQLQLDPQGSQGKAEIYAHILGASRDADPLAEDRVTLVLDSTPPKILDLVESNRQPLKHELEKPLNVVVRVTDELSGPKALQYWLATPPTRNAAGELEPPGLPAVPAPLSSEYQTRDFTIRLEKVDAAEPGRIGQMAFYLRAQDYSGEWSKVGNEPMLIDYSTLVMPGAGGSPGKPRDVHVTVGYNRGGSFVPCRKPHVELLDAGPAALPDAPPKDEADGNAQGVAILKKVPPGKYQLKAAGTIRNSGVVEKTEPLEVPDDGAETPIKVQILLE